MKPIRLGFVGAGKQAQCAHIRNYATLPDCTLAAIADPDEILSGKVAARYGIEQVYTSHKEMIAKANLDAIIVTLPAIPAAEPVVCDILAAKIPVFVEKPLAYSVAAAERVVAAAKTHGTLIAVGYHKRSDPAVMFAKAEIDRLKKTGELGKLRYARVHVCLAGRVEVFRDEGGQKTLRPEPDFKALRENLPERISRIQKGLDLPKRRSRPGSSFWKIKTGVSCRASNVRKQ